MDPAAVHLRHRFGDGEPEPESAGLRIARAVCEIEPVERTVGVSLFDVYRGEKIPAGKKQYALSFVLQDLEHTLTDNEVENAMQRVLSALQAQFGAALR